MFHGLAAVARAQFGPPALNGNGMENIEQGTWNSE
jgi:hypothetical protein